MTQLIMLLCQMREYIEKWLGRDLVFNKSYNAFTVVVAIIICILKLPRQKNIPNTEDKDP